MSAKEYLAPPPPKATYSLRPRQWSGQTPEEILSLRQRHLSAGQYHFYNVPLMLVEAKMQYCFDEKGRQYVDGYSNVCHVGHCHPHFVAQTQNALENIISNTRYLHPAIANYADRLKKTLPPSLSVCYFVNSGSEANDLAMRLARVFTGRNGVICLENSYHGTTQSCTGVSTSLSTGTTKGAQDYKYCARDVHVVPVPDTYRGEYRADDPEAGRKYAAHIDKVCKKEKRGIACFIHEGVQGVGGQIVYPIDYLQNAYETVRADGGVVICDEVQTGFGRTGTHFWAFQAQGVVPDILTLGKPIGNGFPLGAVICRREIAQAFDSVQYFNTNGGNPVACAAGNAVLDIIERDNLQENALQVSRALMPRLRDLMSKHPIVGDVRGVGLFVGIELVRDHTTLEPAREETNEAMELCRVYGLLVGKGGANGNVIRIKPPMCFNMEDMEFMVRTLDRVFSDIETKTRLKDIKSTATGVPISYNPPCGGTLTHRTSMRQRRAAQPSAERRHSRRDESSSDASSSDDEDFCTPRSTTRPSGLQSALKSAASGGRRSAALQDLVEESLRHSSRHGPSSATQRRSGLAKADSDDEEGSRRPRPSSSASKYRLDA